MPLQKLGGVATDPQLVLIVSFYMYSTFMRAFNFEPFIATLFNFSSSWECRDDFTTINRLRMAVRNDRCDPVDHTLISHVANLWHFGDQNRPFETNWRES